MPGEPLQVDVMSKDFTYGGAGNRHRRPLPLTLVPTCLDWSMRRPHSGGSLGAALLQAALKRKWVTQDLDCRALTLTVQGRREFASRWGLVLPEAGRDSSGRKLTDSTPGSVHAR